MLTNLFGKNFKIVFLLIIILELLSFWSHQFVWLNIIAFSLLLLLTLVVSLIKFEYGFYILLTELFIGSKGYLFFLDLAQVRISIRIGLFLVIMSVWLINLIRGKSFQFFSKRNQFLYFYFGLFLFVAIGLINGLAHHSFNNVFFDFNGWLYFALVPVFFTVVSSQLVVRKILSILLAAVSYLSLKTLLLLVIFTHQFLLPLSVIYKWVRDSGVGEITLIGENFYRVFFQAHFYVLIGFFVVMAVILLAKRLSLERWEKILLYVVAILSSTTLLASLSRSYWLGLGLAIFCWLVFYFVKLRPGPSQFIKSIILIILILGLEVIFLSLITGQLSGVLIKKRLSDPTQEAAGSSRLAQLAPVWSAIKENFLLGSGFGQTVTYQTNDPRIRVISPDGRYTTYAFEWGYLDIWLKIGFFGLLSYLILLVKVFWDGLKLLMNNDELFALIIGLLLGLLAAVITSIFSPYLNHPLGIGYLMLVSSLLYYFRTFAFGKKGE